MAVKESRCKSLVSARPAVSGEAVHGSPCSGAVERTRWRLVAKEEDPHLAPRRDFGLARDTGKPISIGHGMKHRRALIPGEARGVSCMRRRQDHPQVGRPAILIANGLNRSSRDLRVKHTALILHLPQGRPNEKFEGDHARDGIPRQRKDRFPFEESKGEGLAWPHVDPPDPNIGPQLVQGVSHEVEVSDRHPAGRQEQIRPDSLPQVSGQQVLLVGHRPEENRQPSGLKHLGPQGVVVAVVNLSRRRHLVPSQELIPGGKDTRAGAVIDRYPPLPQSSQKPNDPRPTESSCGKDLLPRLDILPPVANILAGPDLPKDQNPLIRSLGVLLPNDGIGTPRQWGSRHDPDDLSVFENATKNLTRPDGPDEPQLDRLLMTRLTAIFSPEGESVHGRVVPRGDRFRRNDVFGHNPTESIEELHILPTDLLDRVEHYPLRCFNCNHVRPPPVRPFLPSCSRGASQGHIVQVSRPQDKLEFCGEFVLAAC